MAFVYALLLSLLFSLSSSPSSAASVEPQTTVYEVLQEYNFPVGLLPAGVAGYKLDTSTGKISINLNSICNIKVDKYDVKYEPVITGNISNGKLTTINGIEVSALFTWFNIAEVKRDGDNLVFSAGISASFPVRNFNHRFTAPIVHDGFENSNSSFFLSVS